MSNQTAALVDDYTAAVSDGDFDRLAELVHPDATFGGTVSADAQGVDSFVQGFRNLRPITVRTHVHETIVDGQRAAVMYDLVTDTSAGSVLCSEFLTIEDDLIKSSTLIFDWRQWPAVIDEIRTRVNSG
ncbi:MAG: nuclear transport factor 2 family protein [Acidimicrobiales bacterium]